MICQNLLYFDYSFVHASSDWFLSIISYRTLGFIWAQWSRSHPDKRESELASSGLNSKYIKDQLSKIMPHTLFILFWATGDLTKRYLFPALSTISEIENIDIIATGRRIFSDAEFHDFLRIESLQYFPEQSASSDFFWDFFIRKLISISLIPIMHSRNRWSRWAMKILR